jgi:hypothetical protein
MKPGMVSFGMQVSKSINFRLQAHLSLRFLLFLSLLGLQAQISPICSRALCKASFLVFWSWARSSEVLDLGI